MRSGAFEAVILMRAGCADSIGAREHNLPHRGRIHGRSHLFAMRTLEHLQSRGGPYMSSGWLVGDHALA